MTHDPLPTNAHSTRAVLSLVCGILAYNGCPFIAGIAAILLAWGETSGLARAGSILGWINVAFCGLALLIGVLLLLAAAVQIYPATAQITTGPFWEDLVRTINVNFFGLALLIGVLLLLAAAVAGAAGQL